MEEKDFNNLQRQIRETREIAERNHELIDKVYSMLWQSRVFSIIYWVVLIGIAVGAFYFLEPYINQLVDVYGNLESQLNAIPGTGGS